MKGKIAIAALIVGLALLVSSPCYTGFGLPSFGFLKKSVPTLTPVNQLLEIPISTINDGKAHHFKVQSDNGTTVTFFVLKSKDGILRAAIDACDVCFRAGLGYRQEQDYMVCENCGQKFASNKINIIRGGCNPAPLHRWIKGDNLLIHMRDINNNSWYCEFKN